MMLVADLPHEIVATILRVLESLEDLGQAILTCRHFYNTFKLYKDIPGTILASTWDPDLLPLAVATELVREVPHPRTGHDVRKFVDSLIYDPKNVTQTIKRMDMSSLLSMRQTEGAVFDLAFDMAEEAYKQFDFDEYVIAYEQANVGLSPAEALRFCRAVYCTQLYFEAFPDEASVREGQIWLLTSFAMFEIEQIACVYDYLERVVLKFSRYIFAKDYSFGRERYDFLNVGENPTIEKFINQGVVWIATLLNIDFQDPATVLRDELRQASHRQAHPRLYQALSGLRRLHNDGEVQSQYRKAPRDNFDPDPGPPSALDYANMDLMEVSLEPGTQSDVVIVPSMKPEDYGLRERAYVLWDLSRMKNQDVFYQMEIAPEASTFDPEHWQLRYMNEWHDLCQQLSLEQIEIHYPRIFQACQGWEKKHIHFVVIFGGHLNEREAWESEKSTIYGSKHYFPS